MIHFGKKAALAGLAVVLCAAGCGGKKAAPPGSGKDGGGGDAAAGIFDGSAEGGWIYVPDAGWIYVGDASWAGPDGGPGTDAGTADGGDSGSSAPSRSAQLEIDIGDVASFYDQRGFDVAVGTLDFALAYENHDPDKDCTGRIDVLRIPTTGAIPEAETPVNAKLSQCSNVSEPAVIWDDASYKLVWSDDRSGSVELYSIKLGSTKAPSAITDNPASEKHAALTLVQSKLMAAWIAEDPDTGKRAIYTQLIGVTGSQPKAVIAQEEGRMPLDLVIAHVGSGNTEKAVIGWVDLNQATQGIFVQQLNADGSADGVPQQLLSDPTYAGPGSTLDIAGANAGGAVVYSISIGYIRKVCFMRIDADGKLKKESYLELVAPPRGEGKDASIVKWGAQQSNQYLIAYRAVAGNNLAEPTIRSVAVDLGTIVNPSTLAHSDIATAAGDGGRITIRMANDGTALIVWVDAVLSTQKVLRIMRL